MARGLAHGGVLWKKVLPDQVVIHLRRWARRPWQRNVAYVVFSITPGDGTVDYANRQWRGDGQRSDAPTSSSVSSSSSA